METTWSDNRLSVPLYLEEDYNVPYISPAISTHRPLTAHHRNTKSSCRVHAGPGQRCRIQEVSRDEDGEGGSSSRGGSPLTEEDVSHTSCHEGLQEESREQGTQSDACTDSHLHSVDGGDVSGVFCSRPDRPALRKQAYVQQSLELSHDPWVRLPHSSLEDLPETCCPSADSPEPPALGLPAGMDGQEVSPDLRTFDSLPPKVSSDMSHTPSPKKGPPVAPKPAWFRQSVRKFQNEEQQRRPRNLWEKRSGADFSRSFGVRSASSAARLSIQQKIHCFESFSSPDQEERRTEKVCGKNCTSSPGGAERGADEGAEQVRAVQGVTVRDTKSPEGPADPSASCQTSRSSSVDEAPSLQPPTAPPPSKSISIQSHSEGGPQSVSVYRRRGAPVGQDGGDLHTAPTSIVLQSEPPEGDVSSKGRSQGNLQAANRNKAPANEGNHLMPTDLEGLEKVVVLSKEVSQVLMHFLSTYGHQNLQHGPSAEPLPPQDTEPSPTGFSFSLAVLSDCSGRFWSTHGGTLRDVLPSPCAQMLVQKVEHLDQNTLKDVHVVCVQKQEGVGLGFSVAGGCDLENKAPTVHKVFPGGLAAQLGLVQKGDVVLSVNGQSLQGVPHTEATAAVRQARHPTLAVVVVCRRSEEQLEETTPTEDLCGLVVQVELQKGVRGVGFTLEGGRGSIHGDRPLVINRIFKDGAAEQQGLQCGDELLKVQDISVQEMSRFEAWNTIKALPQGPVTAVIRRCRGTLD